MLSSNWVDANSLLQISVSIPYVPAPPLVLSVALLTLSTSIEANLIGCTSSGLSGNNTSGPALHVGGYFCFNCCNVFSVRGQISFFRLSVSSLIASWMVPLLISRLKFFDISLADDLKTIYSRHLQEDVSQTRLEDILEEKKMLRRRRLQDIFKTFSTHLCQEECVLG